MAFASIFALSVMCPPIVTAQWDCPPTDPGVTADTLDLAGYYPLAIGNMREYVTQDGVFRHPRREEVVADTSIADVVFYKIRVTHFDGLAHPIVDADTSYRYVSVHGDSLISWRSNFGTETLISRLSHPFSSCYEEPFYGEVCVSGCYQGTFTLLEEGEEVERSLPSVKSFLVPFTSRVFGYGIGLIEASTEVLVVQRLVYARIGSGEYGTKLDSLFTIAVRMEGGEWEPHGRTVTIEAFPNPAASRAILKFEVESHAWVRLQIVDLLGREVSLLLDQPVGASGWTSVVWEADSQPAGVYFARLTINGHTTGVKKLVVLR